MVSLSFHIFLSIFFFLLFSEKCQNLRIKSYPYSKTDNCRALWACNFGKVTTTCCSEGFRYVPYRSCVEDLKCKDICPPTFHQEGHQVDFQKPDKYEQYVDGLGWVENKQPCAPGTQIDSITCKCSQLIGKRKIKLVTLKKD